jgi:hypothetical protein
MAGTEEPDQRRSRSLSFPCSDLWNWTILNSAMSSFLTRGARSVKSESRERDSAEDSRTFNSAFSHSGALLIVQFGRRAIEAAKARLRVLGINPEDPSSEEEDPKFKLS